MKNAVRLPGVMRSIAIISIALIIGFTMAACDTGGGGGGSSDPDLEGTILITPSTATVGEELTATYGGSEAVSFQWKKDGSNAGSPSTTNPNIYMTTDTGSYTVTVSASGYKSKTSTAVTVTAGPTGETADDAIPLTAGAWRGASANLWFSFTATAASQYAHIDCGTAQTPRITLYESSDPATPLDSYQQLNGGGTSTELTLTAEGEYLIQVTNTYSNTTYRIAFSDSAAPPAITLPAIGVTSLTYNVWSDCEFPAANSEKWFSFTATAALQYIHFGNSNEIRYMRFYDSNGVAVGSGYQFFSSGNYLTKAITVSSTYYIKLWSGYTDSFHIGFTEDATPPPLTVPVETAVALTADTWENANLAVNVDDWFSFTATASSHILHIFLDTLPENYGVRTVVYTADGTEVASEQSHYYSSMTHSLTGLSNGTTYYVRVFPYVNDSYGVGTYRIAFNDGITPPAIDLPITGVIEMDNDDEWYNGEIETAGGVQWFKFTSTATTQYIHQATDSEINTIYVLIFDENGVAQGGMKEFYSSYDWNASWALENATDYYARVSAAGGTGTFRLAFNNSTTPPTD